MSSIPPDHNHVELEINYKKKTGKLITMEIKQHAPEQASGHQRNQNGNKNVFEIRKIETQHTNCMEGSKCNFKTEDYTDNCNNLTLHLHNREGNGTPLQYPCLENPMDGGAW